MRVARIAAVILLCSAAGGFAFGQSEKEASAAEKSITATLREMYEAERRKDLKFVLSKMANDFTEVAGDGRIYHRADIEAGWSKVVLKEYKLTDCVFNLLTPDAACLSCVMDVEATYKSKPLPQKFRVTTVWTRSKGEWKLRFEQGTILPKTESRD